MAANPEIERYIYDAAVKRGIDPNTALEVARREALNVFDPSRPDLGGDERSSFGPFQLHYAGLSKNMPNAGLGDEFTRVTGLHASDPSTWRQQVDFALDYAKRSGWDPWMGAKAAGITGMMGIGGQPGPRQYANQATTQGGNAVGQMTDAAAGAPQPFDYDAALKELLASRPREVEQPPSLLADDLASSVGRRQASGGGDNAPSPVSETAPGPPLDFASAVPENPPSAAPVGAPEAAATPPLADLFTVKEIGLPNEIDPATGQPRPFRSRRAYG
jgi:hypothetical protein